MTLGHGPDQADRDCGVGAGGGVAGCPSRQINLFHAQKNHAPTGCRHKSASWCCNSVSRHQRERKTERERERERKREREREREGGREGGREREGERESQDWLRVYQASERDNGGGERACIMLCLSSPPGVSWHLVDALSRDQQSTCSA